MDEKSTRTKMEETTLAPESTFTLYYPPSPPLPGSLSWHSPPSTSSQSILGDESSINKKTGAVKKAVTTGHPNSHGSLDTQVSFQVIEPVKFFSQDTETYKNIFFDKYERKYPPVLEYVKSKGRSMLGLDDFLQIDKILSGHLNTIAEIKPVVDSCYQLLLTVLLDLIKKKRISLVSDKAFFLLVYTSIEKNSQDLNSSLFNGETFTASLKSEFLKIGCKVESLEALLLQRLLNRKEFDNKQKIFHYNYLLPIARDILEGNSLKFSDIKNALYFDFHFILSIVLNVLFSGKEDNFAKISGKVFFAIADFSAKNKSMTIESLFNPKHVYDEENFMAIALSKNCLQAYEAMHDKTRPTDPIMALGYLEKSAATLFKGKKYVLQKDAQVPAGYCNFIDRLIQKRLSCYKGVLRQIRKNTLGSSKLLQLPVSEHISQCSLVLQGIKHCISNLDLLLTYTDSAKHLIKIIRDFLPEFEKNFLPITHHQSDLFSTLEKTLIDAKALLTQHMAAPEQCEPRLLLTQSPGAFD